MLPVRKLSLILIVALLILGSIPSITAQSTDRTTPADITITDTIIATDVEPIGLNLTTITGGTNLATNNLIRGSGMEPARATYLVRVERFGPDWMEWDQSFGGVSMWDQNATGFGDGASVRLYRMVDAAGQPLSYGGGTELQEASDAAAVVLLGETTVPPGGWIAEGSEGTTNRVYLSDAIPLAYGDHALITVTRYSLSADDVHPRLHEWFDPNYGGMSRAEGVNTSIVPHTAPQPDDFSEAGAGCLEATFPSGGGWIGQYLFHGLDEGEGTWYAQLEPGEPYRAEVWLRQEGIPDGQVSLYVGGAYEGSVTVEPWTVTDTWQRYTVDFIGPPYLDPPTYHGLLGLRTAGGGTLWVDNFVVYKYDEYHDYRPFTPFHVAFDELMAAMPPTGPKPAVRFYPVVYPGHSTVERLLSNYPSSGLDFIYNVQASPAPLSVPHAFEFALATGADPTTRVVPIITLPEEYTEVEWAAIAEYVGVPYDPASDTPESKPYAYLRYQQRGTGTAWVDEFRDVILEMGNETWHNGAFGGWDGFGRPGWVHFGGREYGLFARHFLVEGVMAQAWWDEYGLSDKLHFALNATYDGAAEAYGELAAQQLGGDVFVYLGHANYVGPTWETGDVPFAAFDDHGMQETLVGAYTGMFPLIEQVAATQAALAASGAATYRVFAYEGGPSGYYLPGQGEPQAVAISERYGKSLAMGMSALDSWLYSSQNGYGHQAYLGYASGNYWSSHTLPYLGGFRRHTGWLALMMRNLYAEGTDMLQTTFNSVPSYQREGQSVPLMSAYTLRGDDSLSVFLLSRQLDTVTPVTLHLPISQCSAVTRYALTAPDGSPADPRASNTEAENVVINRVALDPAVCAGGTLEVGPSTGGVEGGMAPGTVYLYVFEE